MKHEFTHQLNWNAEINVNAMVYKNQMTLNTDLNTMPTIRDNDFSFT